MTASEVTPPGIENTQNSTKQRGDSQSPTEKPKAQIASRGLTRGSGSMAAKLAIMAVERTRGVASARETEPVSSARQWATTVVGEPELDPVTRRLRSSEARRRDG